MRGFVKFCIQRPVFTGCSVIIWLLLGISSYLGLGVPPPNSSLGRLLQGAQATVLNAPWAAIAPGVMIVAIVLGANFLADGLRERFDPTRRTRA